MPRRGGSTAVTGGAPRDTSRLDAAYATRSAGARRRTCAPRCRADPADPHPPRPRGRLHPGADPSGAARVPRTMAWLRLPGARPSCDRDRSAIGRVDRRGSGAARGRPGRSRVVRTPDREHGALDLLHVWHDREPQRGSAHRPCGGRVRAPHEPPLRRAVRRPKRVGVPGDPHRGNRIPARRAHGRVRPYPRRDVPGRGLVCVDGARRGDHGRRRARLLDDLRRRAAQAPRSKVVPGAPSAARRRRTEVTHDPCGGARGAGRRARHRLWHDRVPHRRAFIGERS
ncbi:unannotated protein [freshwater metagenome]|uniref:Unannotated protein n=1 Tax=freshwater metagenome TaxID=449393 RepID=A0A6J6VV57_9ZZZZ